jgi:glutamine synthetase
VLNPDGTPHPTNGRHLIPDDTDDYWFGFEQEYILEQDGKAIGFPRGDIPPQGPYYCAVGYGNVTGRNIIEEHL